MYLLGLALMGAGVIVAVVGVVTAFNSLRDDVNDLRRNVADGELLASLERGDYVVYDEDGFDIGPFEVDVVRVTDGAQVATQSIVDGFSYDVDGRDGTARVQFSVPSSDLYRIEVESSPGSVVRFALGGEVSPVRDRLALGLLIGGLLFVIGLVVLVWTGFSHARWQVRHVAARRVAAGRDAFRRAVGDEGSGAAVTGAVESASSRARDAIGDVRSRVDEMAGRVGSGAEGLPSPPRSGAAMGDRAGDLLDRAEALVGDAESRLADQVGSEAGEVADSIDAAMARVESRLAAGEPLRDIARDEALEARATAAGWRSRADQLGRDLRTEARDAAATVSRGVGDEIGEVRETAGAVVDGAVDELASRLTGVVEMASSAAASVSQPGETAEAQTVEAEAPSYRVARARPTESRSSTLYNAPAPPEPVEPAPSAAEPVGRAGFVAVAPAPESLAEATGHAPARGRSSGLLAPPPAYRPARVPQSDTAAPAAGLSDEATAQPADEDGRQ
jgi:hypothetical protein